MHCGSLRWTYWMMSSFWFVDTTELDLWLSPQRIDRDETRFRPVGEGGQGRSTQEQRVCELHRAGGLHEKAAFFFLDGGPAEGQQRAEQRAEQRAAGGPAGEPAEGARGPAGGHAGGPTGGAPEGPSPKPP